MNKSNLLNKVKNLARVSVLALGGLGSLGGCATSSLANKWDMEAISHDYTGFACAENYVVPDEVFDAYMKTVDNPYPSFLLSAGSVFIMGYPNVNGKNFSQRLDDLGFSR